MPEESPRRDFFRTLALGATAGWLPSPAPVVADDDEPETSPAEAEVDARMAILLARHGDRLDDDAREAIRDDVAGVVRRGEALRKFALENADEPFTVFTPYRAPLVDPQREGSSER